MIRPVPVKPDFPRQEEATLRYWQVHHVFPKSESQRAEAPRFTFYETPQDTAGEPAIADLLPLAVKDAVLRFKVMSGQHLERRAGWNTHGMAIEAAVEAQLGLSGKTQIEAYGVEHFYDQCRRTAFKYLQDWVRLTERAGYWTDLEEAYVTQTNEYIESIWWAFKSLWEKDLLVPASRLVPYCAHCGTALAAHETAAGTRRVDVTGIYVRLPLVEDPGTSLLVWTESPWTLTANVAVAVHPERDYVIVEHQLEDTPAGAGPAAEKLILAKSQLKAVFADQPLQVFETFKGRELKDLRYKPLFTYLLPDRPAYQVILDNSMPETEGTGLIPLSPAYDRFSQQTAKIHGLPVLETVLPDGTLNPHLGPWRGQFPPAADPAIMADLHRRGLLLQTSTRTHQREFCVYCQAPLIYLLRPAWFLQAAQLQTRLEALASSIQLHPETGQTGFTQALAAPVDWLVSRARYWGTPLPVWSCPACGCQQVIGSVGELSRLAGRDLSGMDLHRPQIDMVRFPCPHCAAESGAEMARLPEVLDALFDQGLMPIAQWHVPFENEDNFAAHFPADLVVAPQPMGDNWLYAMHAASVMLYDRAAFQQALTTRLVHLSAEVEPDPWEGIEAHGVDVFRWALCSAGSQEAEILFTPQRVEDALAGFIEPLWDALAFFTAYAGASSWAPGNATQMIALLRKAAYTPLDRWLLSELHGLIEAVTTAFERYDVAGATRPLHAFVQQLAGWYLPRARARFQQPLNQPGVRAAYAALYETLVTLCRLIAPVAPFLAEEIYQTLLHRVDENTAESVHLTSWPSADATLIDPQLDQQMALIQALSGLGARARREAGLRGTQPLHDAIFILNTTDEVDTAGGHAGLLAEALNVKTVYISVTAREQVNFTLRPRAELLEDKYGARFGGIRDSLILLDPESTARQLLDGDPLKITLDGEPLVLLPEEIELHLVPKSGYSVAHAGAYLVLLNLELTAELRQEGLAQEFIQQIQALRRSAGVELTAPVEVRFEAGAELTRAVLAYREQIQQAADLASLTGGAPLPDMHITQVEIHRQEVVIGLQRSTSTG